MKSTRPDAPATVKPAFGGRVSGCEGLRGILCLGIVLYHVYLFSAGSAGPPTTGWPYKYFISELQLGLTVFFIMSAFLLYRPFVRSLLNGKRRPSYGAYLANRVLRVFPGYWTVLGVAAVLGLTIIWIPKHDIGFHLPTFLANLALVHNFHPSGAQTGIPPSWTLAVEWVFYLGLVPMAALMFRLGARASTLRGRRLAALAPPAILLVLGVLGHAAVTLTATSEDPHGVLNTWHAVVTRGFWAWADVFAVGMVIAVFHAEHEAGRLRLPRWWRHAAVAVWALISVTAIWALWHGGLEFNRYNLIMGMACGFFFAAVVTFDGDSRRDWLLGWIEWRPFTIVGLWSLSVYVWHYPVLVMLLKHDVYATGWGGMAFNIAVTEAITLGLAAMTYRFIEKPFMDRKRRTTVPPPAAGLPTAAGVAA